MSTYFLAHLILKVQKANQRDVQTLDLYYLITYSCIEILIRWSYFNISVYLYIILIIPLRTYYVLTFCSFSYLLRASKNVWEIIDICIWSS